MSACNDLKCSELLCVPTQSLPPGYSTIFFEAAMSGGRARNTASAAELCRLMRLHVGHLDEEKYRASNYEDVVTEYEELMLDILALTERPNRSALEAAAKLAFTGVQASEKAMFAQQLHKAFKGVQDEGQICDVRGKDRSFCSPCGEAIARPGQIVCDTVAGGVRNCRVLKRRHGQCGHSPTGCVCCHGCVTAKESQALGSTPLRGFDSGELSAGFERGGDCGAVL